ncbi:rIIA-like protector protein [Rhodococcus phage Weasels2]|uniref:RIIA-like protector protein n=1 Tax=Rhodococcus phage Weasels2 TaxID=1897437 RepID=A0A1I9SAA2_9CAUD|nr:RIIA lysis inhibitor [Rhodococcus phage Weasels2]AOZ63708.1 rIIA-like protector protein [Rhodococcus phage Weasels2]
MIPNKSTIYTEGSLGGEIINMGVDESSLSNIMSLLTDMYSDKIMACIREYSTNAVDSNIAAGNPDPVKITTPTALHPYLVIRDEGLGLSSDDIKKIYSRYGASTKRESNDFNGTLGIGCKAALTYADQFTLTGIKDGIETLVAISRSADGAGTMEIVAVSPTSLPNGVTVQIPVTKRDDRDIFYDKAIEFARFTRGSVLVNGKHVELDGKFVHDQFWVREPISRWSSRTPQIVMGGVAYPIDGEYLDVPVGRDNLIYFAEMGEVDFPPSRESLMYTTNTIATLKRIEKEYTEYLKSSFEDEISKSLDIHDAWSKAKSINYKYSANFEFQYNGLELPEHVDVLVGTWSTNSSLSSSANWSWVGTINHKLIINGWTNKVFSKVQSRKIVKYLEEHHPDLKDETTAYFMPELPEDPTKKALFAKCTVIHWEDIKTVAVAAAQKTVKPERMWMRTDDREKAPDKTKQLYYGQRSDWSHRVSDLFNSDEIESYYVSKSQQPTFLKKYPDAKPLHSLGKNLVIEWLQGLTADDHKAFSLHAHFYEAWTLNVDDILDPDLKLMVQASSQYHTNKKTSLFDTRQQMLRLNYYVPDAELNALGLVFPDLGSGGSDVLDKYPLLKYTDLREYQFDLVTKPVVKKQMTDYVNNVWKELNANGTV